MIQIITFIAIALFSITSPVIAQVPPQWDTSKAQLTNKLNLINTEILNRWDNQPYCTKFGGNLLLANSNKGYKLFTPDPVNFPFPIPTYQNAFYAKIDTMLMALDTLGLKSVDVTIQYPLLVNSFPHSQDYLDFFVTVCNKIKQRGFKLTIGTQAAFVDPTFGETYMVQDILKHYYNPDNNTFTDDTLENNRFRQEKLQMMQTVIDSLKPDYLIMEMEPQTQVNNLFGLVDYSVDSTITHINYFLNNLIPNTTLLGAGAGSWDDIQFIKDIALTGIDFIDYHVYPPHFNYINDIAFTIDSIADANNKKLIIGEAWCYKATNYEMSSVTDPVGTSAMIYARDGFDYWVGVDTMFVKAMINLSQQSKLDVVSFFWVNNFFGQLTWNNGTHGSMTPSQLLTAGQQAGLANMNQFILSPIGTYAKNEIAAICSSSTSIIEHSKSKDLRIYPNPTTSSFIISSTENVDAIIIYDYSGKIVMEERGQNITTVTLPASFTDGIYLLRLRTNNQFQTAKIIVDK